MMKTYLRLICILFVLLLSWQMLIIIFNLPNYILPSPKLVFLSLYEQKYLILPHALITLIEMLSGFLLGIALGCFAGLIIAYHTKLRHWFLPLLIISQALPTFAIAPLLIIWLGYGIASKIAITILIVFFPITSGFYDGLSQINAKTSDLIQIMNANKWRAFWNIRIPCALPSLASGIRIAAVSAPIGAIVGEWVGSSSGLGYLMLNANARMQIDFMFAVVIVIVFLALVLYFSIDKLLQKLIWWETK